MSKITFTKHARERARLRHIAETNIEQILSSPDKKIELTGHKIKFLKTIGQRHYQVVATYLAKEQQWLVISVWVRGEEDKEPLVWVLISLPFRLLRWLLKVIWSIVAKIAGKK